MPLVAHDGLNLDQQRLGVRMGAVHSREVEPFSAHRCLYAVRYTVWSSMAETSAGENLDT